MMINLKKQKYIFNNGTKYTLLTTKDEFYKDGGNTENTRTMRVQGSKTQAHRRRNRTSLLSSYNCVSERRRRLITDDSTNGNRPYRPIADPSTQHGAFKVQYPAGNLNGPTS